MRTIGSSGPPTSFQFVTLPVQMSVACAEVRPLTPVTSGLTTITQPCLATTWSLSAPASVGWSFDSAVTSELPIWIAPWLTWVRPVPEPPPWTWTCAPGQADVIPGGLVDERLQGRRAGGRDAARSTGNGGAAGSARRAGGSRGAGPDRAAGAG